jgi:diguanylate cyclase (GGDEF)-like protein
MNFSRSRCDFGIASLGPVVCLFLATLALGLFSPAAGWALSPGAAPGFFQYSDDDRFERLVVDDGLPSATVLGVLQDQQGFMWFATADGLARYDGYQFKTFRHDLENSNSLSNNNTFALIETRDGLIWVGTDPGGLNVYNPRTDRFQVYRHDPQDPNSLPDDSVWALLEARDGSIWIGTRGGLSHFDRASGAFTNYLHDPENPRSLAWPVVQHLYRDRAGTIWIGTRAGLQRYDPVSDDFSTFKHDPDNPLTISASNVWAMLEDEQGNFWVGTRGGGLNLLDRETGVFKAWHASSTIPGSLSDNRIWSIYQDSAQRIWITTENGGLNLFDPQTGKFTVFRHNPNDPFSLGSDDVFGMCEDKSGVLWVTGRGGGGVSLLYPAIQRFGWYRHIPENPDTLSSNNVFAILPEADGTVWVGTFGGGVNRIDRKTGEAQAFRANPANPVSLSSDKIYDIFRDANGTLWIATSGGGLNRLDETSGQFTAFKLVENDPTALPTNFITSIEQADGNRLWLGTLGLGLVLFEPSTGQVLRQYKYDKDDPASLSEDTIYDLASDSLGRLWIATARGGLERFDPQTGSFTHHRHDPADPNSILSDTLHSLYLDEANGILWAGTAGGLSRLEFSTGQWTAFTTRDGLASNTIVGVQPDGIAGLWVSTTQGISRFDAGLQIFRNFDVRDGLQGNQYNIASTARAPDGEVFFGGPNGLNYFHSEDVFRNPYEPKVVLTGFELFNLPVETGGDVLEKPIEYTESITLRHDQSVFTIEFAGLSYQNTSRNLYRYKMDGFDKEWSPPKPIRQATYTNLAPGTYTFMVHAANNDNLWSRTPAQLRIVILPPWWETWWFRLLVILSLVGLVAIGLHLRIQQMRAINIELEKRVLERTSELRDEIRLRQNIEDQLRETNEALHTKLDEIIELQKKLREQAIRDALTGLFNRHYLADVMSNELSRAQRGSYTVTFMLIDLDHFKEINDRYGHQAGDVVLRDAAVMLLRHIRQGDFAFRYGGEEFLIILPGTAPQDALRRAEQLRADFIALKTEVNEQTIDITASIGVAIYPIDGEKTEDILHYVDEALYQAKGKGRDRVIIAPNTRSILKSGG